MNRNQRASEMELGHTRACAIDSQAMGMVSIHPDMSSTLENIKQEPAFHTGSDSPKLSENMKHVDDSTNTFDVKTEVIDNDHYQHTDIQYNHAISSTSNYTDSGIMHDAHVPHVKSEPDDDSLETHGQNQFILEIGTCKDEYYETHAYPNNPVYNLEAGGVRKSGEDMYMTDSDAQLSQCMPYTHVDTKSCVVVLSDIRYMYPDIVTQGSASVHNREPTIKIDKQMIGCVNTVQKPKHKPFTCTVCGVGFTHKYHMNTHVRIHTGEKLHTCSMCEVSFTQKGHLADHMRTHTGEKPYKCSQCGVEFTRKYTLEVHTRAHSRAKPHTCSACEVTLTRKGSLTAHMRTHTGEKPYKCTVCGGNFSDKSNLTSHTRIHTGEKPYKCIICGGHFAHKSTLMTHKRRHTGEKPYKCTVCGVGFAHTSSLNYHTMHTHERSCT